jgi:uncharacterized membrane protein
MRLRQTTDRYGFRYRGGENTRIEAFTDAAFAFAVTLLMIGGGHVPADVNQLLSALDNVPGYAASFALLCLFWYAHYKWYRRYGIEDGRSILLSLLLVFLVLIYVYPLHMMFNAAISIGGGAGSGEFHVRTWADWKVMYIVFGIAYASMSVVILLFYLHAQRLREQLGLDAGEIAITRSGILRWVVSAGVGILSAALALLLRPPAQSALYAVPGFTYCLIALSGSLLRRHLDRQLAAARAMP